MRESGEIVEQSVSRAEQQSIMRARARNVPMPSKESLTRLQQGPQAQGNAYTGRDKFPSQVSSEPARLAIRKGIFGFKTSHFPCLILRSCAFVASVVWVQVSAPGNDSIRSV